jgi:hypothetical protein
MKCIQMSKSRHGNTVVQVLCTANGWTRAFPMANEKNAHDALSLLFQKYGVPNVMVLDGANAQVESDFRRKLCKSG